MARYLLLPLMAIATIMPSMASRVYAMCVLDREEGAEGRDGGFVRVLPTVRATDVSLVINVDSLHPAIAKASKHA